MKALRESFLVVLALQLVSLAVCILGSSVSEHPLALSGSGSAADGLQRLYVVSVDGVLSALDWEGHPVWSYQLAQPLFSSTLNYKTEAGVPLLVPGLNRALYNWDGIKLEQLSVMADDIIDQNFPYGESAALAGAKFREVETVDTFTGQLVYQCSASKCYQSEELSGPPQWMQLLKASSYRVTVRLAQEMTGEEMWNFTVGEVELSLVGSDPWAGEEGDVGGAEYGGSVSVQVDAARGVLYGEGEGEEGERGRWNRQMSAPITSLWVQDGLRLIRVNLSSHSVLPSYQRPSLMMVHYKEKFYIQPMPLAHDSQPLNLYSPVSYTLLGAVEAMAARWGREGERMRVEEEEVEEHKFELALYRNSDLFELCSEHSEGTSVYFMAEEISEGSCQLPRDENGSEDGCGVPPSPPPSRLLEESWWRFAVRKATSVVKYMMFGTFIIALDRLHQKYGRKRTSSSMSSETSEEKAESTDHFPRTFTNSTLENSLTGSSLRKTQRSDSTDSRFGSDYELRGRLGKGGFGVVYHVRNRTDDGEYAVKRILLPRKKSAREKVMREVHALAQLDHANIVRYFHSWVEQAPEGWQHQEQWVPLSRTESYACAEQSPFPSTMPSSSASRLAPPTSSSPLPSNPSLSTLSHDRIHAEVPPPLSTQSHTSSFVIEFNNKTEGEESVAVTTTGGGGEGERGCFPRDLLDNRDDLSNSSDTHLGGDDDRGVHQLEAPTYLFIQMQLCRKESLKDWLAQNIHNRPLRVVLHYFQQVLEAVTYVHQKGLMHRDLKPSNIFFSLEGSVKVGDFGLVTGTSFSGSQTSLQSLKPLVDESIRHTGNIGSHFYMGPEQAAGKKYDQKVDIYSLGVIFFELHHPFETDMERVKVLENLRQEEMPSKFLKTMPQESELVRWLTEPYPAGRPSAEDITGSQLYSDLHRAAEHSPDNHLIPRL